MVDLLLYTHQRQLIKKQFHDMVMAEQIRANVEIIDAFGVLTERLKRPSHNKIMALLFVDSEQELSQILSLQDLLRSIPSILILNDHDPKTTALAHLLRPRFVGYMDWDTRILLSIVTSMIQHWEKREL